MDDFVLPGAAVAEKRAPTASEAARQLGLSPPVAAIYQRLFDAAEAGEQCPSNTELVGEVGYSNPSDATSAFVKLTFHGLILVDHLRGKRIVTIVATGKSTAPPPEPGKAHPRSTAPTKTYAQREVTPAKELVRVENLVCGCCGVRADMHDEHGCRRWRWAA